MGGCHDMAGRADPAQPCRGGQRIIGMAPDQDHLVAAIHGSLAPRLGDAPVVLIPVDAQVTLAAWHFLVLPVTAHDAHRTKIGRASCRERVYISVVAW